MDAPSAVNFENRTAKYDWNRETTLLLIELWASHPCLYDSKNKLYSNKHARYDALSKISDQLRTYFPTITPDDVKIKINYLRGQYSHELAKIRNSGRSGAGADDLYEPSVYWFPKLNFLNKFIKIRKGKSNSLDESSTHQSGDDTLLSVDNAEYIEEVALFSPPPPKSSRLEDSTLSSPTPSTSNPFSSTSTSTPHLYATGKQKGPKTKSAEDLVLMQAANAIKSVTSSMEKGQIKKYAQDVEAFGEYVKAELQKITDEDLKDRVQFEMSSILYEYKKKQRNLSSTQ